jgi:hypothetical protein
MMIRARSGRYRLSAALLASGIPEFRYRTSSHILYRPKKSSMESLGQVSPVSGEFPKGKKSQALLGWKNNYVWRRKSKFNLWNQLTTLDMSQDS